MQPYTSSSSQMPLKLTSEAQSPPQTPMASIKVAVAIALPFRNAFLRTRRTRQSTFAIALPFRDAASAHTALVKLCTRTVVLGDFGVVVAGRFVHATKISSMERILPAVEVKRLPNHVGSHLVPMGKISTLMEPKISPAVVIWAINQRPSLSGEALPSLPVKNQEPPTGCSLPAKCRRCSH